MDYQHPLVIDESLCLISKERSITSRNKVDHFVLFLVWIAITGLPLQSPPKLGVQKVTCGFPLVITDGNSTMQSGSGALNVNEYNGRVNVNRNRPENLSIDYDNEGGRVSVVVNQTENVPLWDVFAMGQGRVFFLYSFANFLASFQFFANVLVDMCILEAYKYQGHG